MSQTPDSSNTLSGQEELIRQVVLDYWLHTGNTEEKFLLAESQECSALGCEFVGGVGYVTHVDEAEHMLHAERDELDFISEMAMFIIEHPDLGKILDSRSPSVTHYIQEGFPGCTNINADYCACENYTDPVCFYCGQAIEEGQPAKSVHRKLDPFEETENGVWESLDAHDGDCPGEAS